MKTFRSTALAIATYFYLMVGLFGCVSAGDGIDIGANRELAGGLWTDGAPSAPIVYENQAFLTSVPFGRRSHWIQPWRAYVETRPASILTDGLGVNMNIHSDDADAFCKRFADAGFKHARIEIGWNHLPVVPGSPLVNEVSLRKVIKTCAALGLRPLILLNANSGAPCPNRRTKIQLTRDARAGERIITVSTASYNQYLSTLTGMARPFVGLDDITTSRTIAAGYSIRDAKPRDGYVEISLNKALKNDLKILDNAGNPGKHFLSALMYEPFDANEAASFNRSLAGWREYVRTVASLVKSEVGANGFDVEVWNELSFGSEFLSINNYSEATSSKGIMNIVRPRLLQTTAEALADPALALSGVKITDGFSSQTPFPSRIGQPLWLGALSKHLYPRQYDFSDAVKNGDTLLSTTAVDATGASVKTGKSFEPAYYVAFPEYYLSAIQTESILRDISPIVSTFAGTQHGRSPTTSVWMTEIGMDTNILVRRNALSTSDREYLLAKSTLRIITSFITKGVERLYLYAATDVSFGLLGNPRGAAPNNFSFNLPLRSISNLQAKLKSTEAITNVQALKLLTVAYVPDAQRNPEGIEFLGDPSTAKLKNDPYPALKHSELVAFYPLQIDNKRLAAVVYVMTRDLGKSYPGMTGVQRFDLPNETFELNLKADMLKDSSLQISYYDPISNTDIPVKWTRKLGEPINQVRLTLPLSDSVRLLTFTRR